MALQADGSCLASSGASHVLATAVCNSAAPVEDDEGMVPLQVIKQEELNPPEVLMPVSPDGTLGGLHPC